MEADVDFVVFLGISTVAAFYFAFRFLRHTRLIEDTPTSKVRSAAQGYVELEGTTRVLESGDVLSALTKTPCVWWAYDIAKRVKTKNGHSWSSIKKDTSLEPFQLEDDTGRCVVNPAGAEVVTQHDSTWYGNSEWPISGPGGSGSGSYRYIERLIHRGALVYALGLFKTTNVAADATEERAALSALLAAWKEDAGKMKLLDVNRDGKVDLKEWEAARRVALKELRQARQPVHIDGLHSLSKAELSSQPFILSSVLQKDLCRRWRIYAALCFAWFLIGGSLFVWQLIEYGLL